MYELKCKEKIFERYLDDMSVMTVNFFDAERQQTVGITRVPIKLYIKRAKPKSDDGPLMEIREVNSLTSDVPDHPSFGPVHQDRRV